MKINTDKTTYTSKAIGSKIEVRKEATGRDQDGTIGAIPKEKAVRLLGVQYNIS